MAEGVRVYEERYCAFIDILGFTELISNIRRGHIRFEAVRDVLNRIHEPLNFDAAGSADFRATTISDAIALSTSLSAAGLASLVDMVSSLALGALELGYFTRGALCRGLLYHDKDTVFGEALIAAYQLESSIARYPRIMVTKQVYDDALGSNVTTYFQTHLTQADDGPYFVDVLEEIRIGLKVIDAGVLERTITDPKLASFSRMREQIERQVAETVDNPDHFEKAQWFARYWNTAFPQAEKRTGRVSGPGLDVVTWRSGTEGAVKMLDSYQSG
jgi:hypothetical protein